MRAELVSAQAQVPAYRLGESAHSMLTSGSHGKVLGATSSAVYLSTHNGDLFWLAAEDSTMHRRSIQLASPLPRVASGSGFAVVDERLVLGSHFVLDFSRASRWDVARPSPEGMLPATQLPERLFAAFSGLADLPSPAGFGILVPRVLKHAQVRVPSRPIAGPTPALHHAWPAICDVVNACLEHNFPRLLEDAEKLIGLGEGLTPSGDDFVGGLLFSLSALGRVRALASPLEASKLLFFLQRSKPLTNLISHTLLTDHAEGHSFEVLHRFTDALLTGQSLARIRQLAVRLIRLGHSTGWDLLTGVVAGMLTALRIHTASTPYNVRSPSLHPS